MMMLFKTAVMVVVVMAALVAGQNGSIKPKIHGHTMLDLMDHHFDLSIKYLYNSYSFAGQKHERPGLAKLLKELSDKQWEAGLEVLNKYLQRGGEVDEEFKNKLKVVMKASEYATLTEPADGINNVYVVMFNELVEDSETLVTKNNKLYREAHQDGDIAHFAQEKLEKLAEHHREMTGYKSNIENMVGLGLAVDMFDSSL